MAIDADLLRDMITDYQDGIDALISAYGKPIIIYFKPSITSVQSSINDVPRNESLRKPDYKINNPPVVTQTTRTIYGLLKNNPKDFQTFNLTIDNPQNILRIKCYLTDSSDLRRCDHISVNDDVDENYILLRQPVPFGLGINRYCLSFWQRV